MPAYEEKEPLKCRSIILLFFAFFIIYSPFQLGNWELRWREDRYAALAMEMNLLHPNTVAHGEQIPFTYPLFPWLTAILHKTGLSLELCMRMLSIGSVAALMVLVWEAGRRAKDIQTGMVAAAMMCSSLIIIEKATDGYPHFTGLLLLFSAWLSWFTFGVARGQWNKAWIVSFFFCSLVFLTIGWHGVLLFLFPLIFMRRPMTVWPKLRKPGFFLGVAMLMGVILLWTIPRVMASESSPFKNIVFNLDSNDYLHYILTYPFALFARYLPWSLIAWPAFCVAYFPLDKNPIFSRFLRTIVISIFFLIWFAPFSDARDFILIAPALSVLCGINYWLLVRRYGHQFHKLYSYLLYGLILFAAGIILFYILPESVLMKIPYLQSRIEFREQNTITGLLQASISILIALITLQFIKKSMQLYTHILMICVSGALCFWALLIPYREQHTEKREMGKLMADALKEDMHLTNCQELPDSLVVYKGPGIDLFYAPCIYMGTRVKKIYKLSELPDSVKTVYMIATKFPASEKRDWKYVTPNPVTYRRENLYILKGTLIQKEKKNSE